MRPTTQLGAASIALAALLLTSMSARDARANVFVADRRIQRDADRAPYRSVGVLHHARLGAGGTAFLVSSCHVATAYHVAFLRSRDAKTGEVVLGSPKVGHTAEFLVGPDARVAGTFAARTRAVVVAYGRFAKDDFAGMAGDWAILRLDDCLGERFGYLRHARDGAPMPDGPLMTIGFPASRASRAGITIETGCRARDHGPIDGLVGIDCAFESGLSGGPVLQLQADGTWIVVGMIQQSMSPVAGVLPEYSMQHRNQMIAVSVFRSAIDDALRADARRLLARPKPRR
jgi:hypothetical protein